MGKERQAVRDYHIKDSCYPFRISQQHQLSAIHSPNHLHSRIISNTIIMAPILTTILTAFALITTISAIPTAEATYPEVIPGKGLPGLASLGLTSK